MTNIEPLRKSRNLTRRDLAQKVGVTEGNIYKWERGHNYPGIRYAIQLADFFEVSLDYLLGRSTA